MILTASVVLGLFALGVALGALEDPERFLQGKRSWSRGLGLLVLAVGHAVVLDQDLGRRDRHHKGGGYIFAALLAPPVSAIVYLVRAYGKKAAVLVPLYLGLLGSAALLGYGLGWLYLQA